MSQFKFDAPSDDAIAVLKLLRQHHNVLIAGPPATGKSRLLAEVRFWFRKTSTPLYAPTGAVAFPPEEEVTGIEEWMPSPQRINRRIWSITFHQGTKYRDFVSGLAPSISATGESFVVTRGPLYEAAEHSRTEDGAALVEVDEINRGSAVTIFGDTITAIEKDKRLLPDGTVGRTTASFRMVRDEDENGGIGKKGMHYDFTLPFHLYIVAAMNEADTSVEPLDVAFLRRFVKYRLLPKEAEVRAYLNLPKVAGSLEDQPSTPQHVFETAVQAWVKINDRIGLARSAALQIGHGTFMEEEREEIPTDLLGALRFAASVWTRLFTHIEEVFFGDTRAIAAVLRAGEDGSPYQLEEKYFVDAPLVRLRAPEEVNVDNVYSILRAVAGGD